METGLARAATGLLDGDQLGPLLLSLRVAALATVADRGVRPAAGGPAGPGAIPGAGGCWQGVLTLPLVLPPTVLGYALLLVLGRRGPIGTILEGLVGGVPVFHWTGLVIAAGVAAFPLFLLPARGAIEAVDPALEDAARLLGRRELERLRPGHAAAGLAGDRRRGGPGLRPGPRRLRRLADGRRRHPRPDPDRRHGDLRRRRGRRARCGPPALDGDLGRLDRRVAGSEAVARTLGRGMRRGA